ncbi:MAG: hypothetical protein ACTSPM_06975 [Candidatus Heimdallarchaeota archaeon]
MTTEKEIDEHLKLLSDLTCCSDEILLSALRDELDRWIDELGMMKSTFFNIPFTKETKDNLYSFRYMRQQIKFDEEEERDERNMHILNKATKYIQETFNQFCSQKEIVDEIVKGDIQEVKKKFKEFLVEELEYLDDEEIEKYAIKSIENDK